MNDNFGLESLATLLRNMQDGLYIKDIGINPKRIYVDRGYRGHDPSLKFQVFKAGQKRLVPQIKKEMKRRSAIEPVIGHLKSDGHLGRNYLKGALGDKINAIFSGIGHNFRLLLRWTRDLFAFILSLLFGRISSNLFQSPSQLNLKIDF